MVKTKTRTKINNFCGQFSKTDGPLIPLFLFWVLKTRWTCALTGLPSTVLRFSYEDEHQFASLHEVVILKTMRQPSSNSQQMPQVHLLAMMTDECADYIIHKISAAFPTEKIINLRINIIWSAFNDILWPIFICFYHLLFLLQFLHSLTNPNCQEISQWFVVKHQELYLI